MCSCQHSVVFHVASIGSFCSFLTFYAFVFSAQFSALNLWRFWHNILTIVKGQVFYLSNAQCNTRSFWKKNISQLPHQITNKCKKAGPTSMSRLFCQITVPVVKNKYIHIFKLHIVILLFRMMSSHNHIISHFLAKTVVRSSGRGMHSTKRTFL